jgi:hypothetical protein
MLKQITYGKIFLSLEYVKDNRAVIHLDIKDLN